jgi:hypothetical protein
MMFCGNPLSVVRESTAIWAEAENRAQKKAAQTKNSRRHKTCDVALWDTLYPWFP